MASDQASNAGPPLDEIQWRMPPEYEGGIHSNTVLYYFAQSPFFDNTSNNYVLFQQGLNNPNMFQYLETRERFEGRLSEMSGLEFIVAQEPAESGPGAGTGVWVINKQTRRKRQGEEDEIVVHATYFIIGENVYMAPSLADILSARIVRSLLTRPPEITRRNRKTNHFIPGYHLVIHCQSIAHRGQRPNLVSRQRSRVLEPSTSESDETGCQGITFDA